MLLNACALLQQQAQTDNALHNLLVRSAATSCTAVAAVPAIHAACTACHQMVHKSNDMSKLQKRQGAENTSSDARHWRTEPGYTAALHASSMMLSRHCQQMACTCCLLTIATPSTQKDSPKATAACRPPATKRKVAMAPHTVAPIQRMPP